MGFGYIDSQPTQVVVRGVDSNGDLTDPADGVVLARQPGDRNSSSTTTDYKRSLSTGTATRADIGTTETVITASPAVLIAIIPNAAHTGNLEVRNAATTGGGATPVFLLDLDPGQYQAIGAEMDTGITLDGTDAACDVTAIWAAL